MLRLTALFVLLASTATAQIAVTGLTDAQLDVTGLTTGFVSSKAALRSDPDADPPVVVAEDDICVGAPPCVFLTQADLRTAAQSYTDRIVAGVIDDWQASVTRKRASRVREALETGDPATAAALTEFIGMTPKQIAAAIAAARAVVVVPPPLEGGGSGGSGRPLR